MADPLPTVGTGHRADRGKRTTDRVRITIPVEVYGDGAVRRRVAELLRTYLGDAYEVTHRPDTGIVIVAHYRRGGGVGDVPAGALSAAAAITGNVERALERIGKLRRPLAQALEQAIPYTVVKVNAR